MDDEYSRKHEREMAKFLGHHFNFGGPHLLLTLTLFRPVSGASPEWLYDVNRPKLERLMREAENIVLRNAISSKHYRDPDRYLPWLATIETRDKKGFKVPPHYHGAFWFTLQQYERFWEREAFVRRNFEDLLRKRGFRRDVHMIDFQSGDPSYLLKYPLDDILITDYYGIPGLPDR